MVTVSRREVPNLFPAATDDLYAATHPLSGAVRPVRVRDAFTVSAGNARHTFRRIVTTHAFAFQSERQGIWDRADFYWTQLWRLIADTEPDDPCWSEGLHYIEQFVPDLTGADVRRSFLRDVVIAAHAALFRTQVDGGLDPLDRPRIHLTGISRVLEVLGDIDDQEESSVVDALGGLAFTHYGESRQQDIERLCFAFVDYFPRQSQYADAALVRLHARTMSQLERAKDTGRRGILDDAIKQVEDVRVKVPSNFNAYQLLGALYLHQSVVLAEAGLVSSALLASRKAEAFGGDHPAVRDTRRQIEDILTVVRRQAQQVQMSLAQPGVQLSEKGRQLVHDATVGSSRADAWHGSQEAKDIRTQRETAARLPARPPASSLMPITALSLVRTEKVSGRERVADMLVSPASRRLRWQIVTAAILAVIAAGLTANDSWARHSRHQALEKIQTARAAHDDMATLNALGEFFDMRREKGDPAEAVLVPLYADTLSRWFNTRIGGLSPEDRAILAQYRRQIVSRGIDPLEVKP